MPEVKLAGYDLDGTICDSSPKRDKPFFRQTSEERKAHKAKLEEHYRNAKLEMHPVKPFVIITGRKVEYLETTKAWCKKVGIEPEDIFMHSGKRKREEMIEHKASCCLSQKVSVYFEDDKKIAVELRRRGINVIIVSAAGPMKKPSHANHK